MDNVETAYKGKNAFYYNTSWCHRKKELNKDGTVKHGRVRGFRTPEEAEESYYKHLKLFESERKKYFLSKMNKEVNFKDYLIYWFEEIYSNKAQSTTLMAISFTLYEYIIPNIQYDLKLRLTTVAYIEEILDRIKNHSEAIANKAKGTLYMAFKDATTENYITSNIIANVKKYPTKKKPITILSKEELRKFLFVVSKGNWYLEILLGLFCGLRKGEIMGLKFTDFNLKEQTVSIERQVAYDYTLKKGSFGIEKTEQVIREPKTQNAIRTLKVPKIIFEQLDIRLKKIELDKKQFKNKDTEGFISIQKNGQRTSVNSLYTYITRACAKHGIRKISVHGLRHMYATILVEQGVSLAKISALLGHSSIHTTFDFYLDVMEEKERITNFMNDTFTNEENYE